MLAEVDSPGSGDSAPTGSSLSRRRTARRLSGRGVDGDDTQTEHVSLGLQSPVMSRIATPAFQAARHGFDPRLPLQSLARWAMRIRAQDPPALGLLGTLLRVGEPERDQGGPLGPIRDMDGGGERHVLAQVVRREGVVAEVELADREHLLLSIVRA
jgi:hypothetical protein